MPNLQLAFLLFSLLLHSVDAQNPDVPQGGGACITDWDCSLGGECRDRVCVCDPWFTGQSCSLLNFAPAEPDYGLQIPKYYSWGGRALHDSKTGLYHGFFSFMCHHATLDSWTTKSASIRAIASTPVGPFSYTEMVIQPWSHNTAIIRNPPDGKFLLFHIGDGVVDPSEWAPCFNSANATDETTVKKACLMSTSEFILSINFFKLVKRK